MSDVTAQRWMDSQKNAELRDAQNFRGLPGAGTGAQLASQQGERGAPIVDASCVAGLELFKVRPSPGTGRFGSTGSAPNVVEIFESSEDYLWSSANNLDLALMMWNTGIGQTGSTEGVALHFGVMLREDSSSLVTPNDVFGAPVSEIVLVSGTFAWRVMMPTTSSNSPVTPTAAQILQGRQFVVDGDAVTRGNVTLNLITDVAFGSSAGDRSRWLSQFRIQTGLPFAVYRFGARRLGTTVEAPGTGVRSVTDPANGGSDLLSLMSANYAGFRVYDFTLQTPRDGGGWDYVPCRMPPSQSGANTNAAQIPNPDDISQQMGNPAYWYITDAMVAPLAARSLTVDSGWVSERTVAVGQTLTVANVAGTAFDVLPSGESVEVGVAPASLASATYSLNAATSTFTFSASASGIYRVVFTGLLTNEPGRRAEAVLTITVP